ncbi:hypothetical protein CONLIGDRAFT_650700 [Coniochaeta ligniaria NRRL 30616]|uniref:Uncharacterized protein n=1 Tax=Coniochaeta ligniaria NRRL 30616 TaxID=1408157 RepID=A0A1J7IM93_9PEZI|nr:hypothetical protein CONLIGDRAFT_650700 [Coniochaeta ligniaria NRRL 30616]
MGWDGVEITGGSGGVAVQRKGPVLVSDALVGLYEHGSEDHCDGTVVHTSTVDRADVRQVGVVAADSALVIPAGVAVGAVAAVAGIPIAAAVVASAIVDVAAVAVVDVVVQAVPGLAPPLVAVMVSLALVAMAALPDAVETPLAISAVAAVAPPSIFPMPQHYHHPPLLRLRTRPRLPGVPYDAGTASLVSTPSS